MPVVSRAVLVEDERKLNQADSVLWIPYYSMEFTMKPGGPIVKRRRKRVSIDAYFSTFITSPANMLLMMRSFVSETSSYAVPSTHVILHPRISDPKELLLMAVRAYQELRREYQMAREQGPQLRAPRPRPASTFMESITRLFYGGKLANKLMSRKEVVIERPKHVEYKIVMNIMKEVFGQDIESPSVNPVVYFSTLVWRPYAVERVDNTLVFKDLTRKKVSVDKIYTGLTKLDRGFLDALKDLGLAQQ